jgi:hypothetical protein
VNATAAYAGAATIPTNPPDEELQRTIAIVRDDSHCTHYTWLEDYLERLNGKEARQEYYARLERFLPRAPLAL